MHDEERNPIEDGGDIGPDGPMDHPDPSIRALWSLWLLAPNEANRTRLRRAVKRDRWKSRWYRWTLPPFRWRHVKTQLTPLTARFVLCVCILIVSIVELFT